MESLTADSIRMPKVEALAQAVLARGQLLAHLGHRHPGEPYNLCGEHHCRAFLGRGR